MRRRYAIRQVPRTERTFGDDLREGLTAHRKSIPPSYFYDDLGSALFEAICCLPEYYLTRAEAECLRKSAKDIASAVGDVTRIVELGSGSAKKTRLLLDALKPRDYVPVDIDAHMLEKTGRELNAEYSRLRVDAVCADFTQPSRALRGSLGDGRTLAIFLGSTIGNFDPRGATMLLRDVGDCLRPGDFFLVGADLKKAKPLLDAAYDDALGVTAAFNLNLLQRINREFGGRFDVRTFSHRAFYDEEQGRIEMHLVSNVKQKVRVDGLNLEVKFAEEETIHTENSYKYTDRDIARMASESEFDLVATFTDPRRLFMDALLKVR